MSIVSFFNLENDQNFVYDSNKIEFISGVSKLKPIVSGAEAYLYVKLDENQGLVARDSSGNQRDGAFQGGLDETNWTTSGKINNAILFPSGGFINFDGIGSFTNTQAFSIEFWASFTSTVSLGAVSKQIDSGNFEGYAVNFLAAIPRFVIRDNVGNVNFVTGNAALNDGNFHHIVATYNGSNDASGMKLYVDNVDVTILGGSATMTGSIITPTDLQISGRNGNTIPFDGILDEVVIYDREITAAEISFRWNGGSGTQILPGSTTSFPTDSPAIISKASFSITKLLNFLSNIVEPGSDSVTFVIVVNGVDMYWNGSAWIESSGVLESNTVAEIQAGASFLVSSGAISIKIKVYLTSNDGTTTPEILDFTIEYDFVGAIEDIDLTIVTGKISDIDGISDTDILKIRLNKKVVEYKDSIQITGDEIIITPDSNGNWQAEIADTDDMEDETFYIFEIKNRILKRLVPKSGSIDFNDLPEVL